MLLCPHCRRELPPILPEYAGHTMACPHCQGAFQAPASEKPVAKGDLAPIIRYGMIGTTILWMLAVLYFTADVFLFAVREGSGVFAAFGAVFVMGLIPTVPYAIAMAILASLLVAFKK